MKTFQFFHENYAHIKAPKLRTYAPKVRACSLPSQFQYGTTSHIISRWLSAGSVLLRQVISCWLSAAIAASQLATSSASQPACQPVTQ